MHQLAVNIPITADEVKAIRNGTTVSMMQAKAMAKNNALRNRLAEIKQSPNGFDELINLIESSI